MNLIPIILFGIVFAVAIYIMIREGQPRTYCYYCLETMHYDSKNKRWIHPKNGCESQTPIGVIK